MLEKKYYAKDIQGYSSKEYEAIYMAVKGKEALNLKSNIHVDRVNETIGK